MIKLYYQLTVHAPNGKVIATTGRRISHSYLKQWNQLILIQMENGTEIVLDIGGVPRNIVTNASNLLVDAAVGQTAAGIVFGLDDDAVLITNWKLANLITHGVGADQLQYQALVYGNPVVVGPKCSFLLTRIATNLSGAPVIIKEAGLYGRAWDGGNFRYICYVRDVLDPPVVVPDTFPVTGQYTVQVIV